MSKIDSKPTIGDWLKSEFDKNHTRETGLILKGQVLDSGSVLQKNEAGKFLLVEAGKDAAGILIDSVDATAADVEVAYIARGPVTVIGENLVMGTSISDVAKREAIYMDLNGAAIVVREEG